MLIPRSYLFLPATRLERLPKALATDADRIVIDLEDAVAPQDKEAAREALGNLSLNAERVMVRINACGTEWFNKDVLALRAMGVRQLMLPKAEDGDAVRSCRRMLGEDLEITALIETAAGVLDARTLAQAPSVVRLAFGSLDFRLECSIPEDGIELLQARSMLVLASRAAGLAGPVDGVSQAVEPGAELGAAVLSARRLGFAGKLCIHPRQVDAVNAGFSPSESEIAWAREVVEATNGGSVAVAQLRGQMIDRPVVLRALNVLAAARSNKLFAGVTP